MTFLVSVQVAVSPPALSQRTDLVDCVHYYKGVNLGRFYAICNCFSCCCRAVQARQNGTPRLASSGYVARVDEDLCFGCGAQGVALGPITTLDRFPISRYNMPMTRHTELVTCRPKTILNKRKRSHHWRMGFDRDRNRQLMAMGRWTMLEVLADPPNLARLEESSKQAVRVLRDVDTGAPHGWRCTNTACRVRDVCTRT